MFRLSGARKDLKGASAFVSIPLFAPGFNGYIRGIRFFRAIYMEIKRKRKEKTAGECRPAPNCQAYFLLPPDLRSSASSSLNTPLGLTSSSSSPILAACSSVSFRLPVTELNLEVMM